jgi:hypothetical protein
MDPLTTLPAEIILRILDFASLDSIARAARLSRAWHRFIGTTHVDAVYAAKLPPRAGGGSRARDPRDYFAGDWQSFSRYGEGVGSWREACRRWTLLARNWGEARPVTTEAVVRVGAAGHFVWRFKPDFRRRFIVSTSQAGGVYVNDMDTGALLWSLKGDGEVRGYAHLEYQDGTAVWDRFGDTLEVWKTDLPGLPRGHFRKVGLLHHDAETRGFQLSYDTLCVVSCDGHGFIYDVPSSPTPPTLRTHLEIPHGAIGHLHQNEHAVMYSMGVEGYHLYDKNSGTLMGHIKPRLVDPFKKYHINHPPFPRPNFALSRLSNSTLLAVEQKAL